MNRIISIIILIFAISIIPAGAQANYTEQANILNQLGLFKGTDKGYDLDKAFTRSEGATMLVRLLGKEKAVISNDTGSIAFTDVAQHWSKPYIAYCVKNNITKGTSETAFSPDQEMTGGEYITLLLRAMGYTNVNPDNAYIAAAEYSLATSGTLKNIADGAFTRDKMVYISYQALFLKDSKNNTLLENLIREQAISDKDVQSLRLTTDKKAEIN